MPIRHARLRPATAAPSATSAAARALLCALAALVVCGAAPRQSCDTRQAAQKIAEASLSARDQRNIGQMPPRVVERGNGVYWEVTWPPAQMGGRPTLVVINRNTCAVTQVRP